MATNLTPEELAMLSQMPAWQQYMENGGNGYQALYSQQGQGETAGPAELTGYLRNTAGRNEVGDPFSQFGAQGNYLEDGKYKEQQDLLLPALLAMGGVYGLGGLINGMTGFGGAAGAGANAMGAGAAGLESGTLASGVTVGGPMSVGMPVGTALPSMGAMAGAGGALGAAASGAGGAGAATAAGSLIPGIANKTLAGGALSLLGAASGAGGSGGAGGAGGGAGLDPRMEGDIYGDKGLMSYTRGLLQQHMPQAQANGNLLMQRGQGLLGGNVAPNPFMVGR